MKNNMDFLSYIDKIDAKKNLMLVYDDIKKGREIEYHFVKRGLEKKERCIYLTHGDPKSIEDGMQGYGINVQHNKMNGTLLVYQMSNPIEDSKSILNSIKNIIQQILVNPKTVFRVVGRIIPDIGFEESISIQLYLEKIFHGLFDELNGSVMCTYDFSQIRSNNEWRDWLDKLESCHHASMLNISDKNLIRKPQDVPFMHEN